MGHSSFKTSSLHVGNADYAKKNYAYLLQAEKM